MVIKSQDNKKYKGWQRLLRKKYRDKEGRYLIEGENLIEEAVRSKVTIEEVILCQGEKGNLAFNENLLEILPPELETYYVEGSLFNKLAPTETSQGIMAVVKKEEQKDSWFQGEGLKSNFIVLDRLQDPGNIGTIIRTAEGAGFGGVIAVKGTGDIYSPKVVRAAAGSIFRMPFIFVDSAEDLLELLKSKGLKSVVTSFDTSFYPYEVDMKEKTAIIIGNEGNGVSKELIDKADIKVKIPMPGGIDSLNAAVAAGILMFQSVEQCFEHGY